MKALETGNEVLGIKEYNLDGCRFLYRPSGRSDPLSIVTFSAFPPRGVPQKYNYIKHFLPIDCSFFSFLDTNLPASDPRGTYYLSQHLSLEYVDKIHHIIALLSNGNKDNTYLLGSSKGGFGALLTGLKHGYPNIIVNAPPARPAERIRRRSLEILSYLLKSDGGHTLKEYYFQELNNVLFNTIENMNLQLAWNIHITCGSEDTYYQKELEFIYDKLTAKNIAITQKVVRGGHDGIALQDYQDYFLNILQKHPCWLLRQ